MITNGSKRRWWDRYIERGGLGHEYDDDDDTHDGYAPPASSNRLARWSTAMQASAHARPRVLRLRCARTMRRCPLCRRRALVCATRVRTRMIEPWEDVAVGSGGRCMHGGRSRASWLLAAGRRRRTCPCPPPPPPENSRRGRK